jgi:hypothetical protein
MIRVFVVQHVLPRGDDHEDVKFIGVYSSRENTDAAVSRLRMQAGFSDTIDGFSVDEYPLDRDQWAEGFVEAGAVLAAS